MTVGMNSGNFIDPEKKSTWQDLWDANTRLAGTAHHLASELANMKRRAVRMLGTLPMTKDGCLCGMGVPLWSLTSDPFSEIVCIHSSGPELSVIDEEGELTGEKWDIVEHCYSTREAASAAGTAEAGEGVGNG